MKRGGRVRHKEKGWGRVLELNPQSSGKTGRPTALVEWETHRVLPNKRHGDRSTWVSQSSLTVQAVAPTLTASLSDDIPYTAPTSSRFDPSGNEETQAAEAGKAIGPANWTPNDFVLPDEASGQGVVEGTVRTITVNAYERDPTARAKCIAAHGTGCSVCGFSFVRVYGEIARDYIHVHHLRPLSEVSEAHEVDPVLDLRPVCPNCHAVLHRRVPVYGIEELQEIIANKRSDPT